MVERHSVTICGVQSCVAETHLEADQVSGSLASVLPSYQRENVGKSLPTQS